LELLADPDSPIPREEALEFIQESSRALLAQLAFARVAFGAGEEAISSGQLRDVVSPLFATIRPSLTWSIDDSLVSGSAARVLLNLVQLAGAALAVGGEVLVSAHLSGASYRIAVDALGPRAKLHSEVQAGLEGRPRGEGLAGRWVQGAFVHAMIVELRGAVSISVEPEAVRFVVTLPA
jgi:histidine phosphotransferase ChpT